ncbi:MAG: galactokinase [Deltaproteobacteria bacterium]|nr:galactokinase [Deltaproteobacteria bacterium]
MFDLDKLVDKSRLKFVQRFGGEPLCTTAAPGRINIIGEHTDYNGGLAMPAAIDRWILVSLRPRSDKRIVVESLDFQSELTFELGGHFEPFQNWQRYITGVVAIFNSLFPLSYGLEASIGGNIPIGSGLSSSGALEVALMNAFRSIYKVDLKDLELIKLCSRVDHEFLNIKSGLLDQFASQFSRRGYFLVIDFCSLNYRSFKADMQDWIWVVVDSGIHRELAGSKYMERVEECKQGLRCLRQSGLSINHFRDITVSHLKNFPPIPSEPWRKRLRHVVSENQRVRDAEAYLSKGDFESLGKILVQSHESLRREYEVSCKELDFLVNSALAHPGCAGGRMMGGGFGGCTLNLIRKKAATDFADKVSQDYQQQFDLNAQVYHFNLVDGVKVYAQNPVKS